MKTTRYILVFLLGLSVAGFSVAAQVHFSKWWHFYKNKPYAFEIHYPHSVKVDYEFSNAYFLGDTWSVNTSDKSNNAYQHSLLQIKLQDDVGTGNDGDQYYYQYYVRIGASAYPADVAHCEKPRHNFDPNPDFKTALINRNKFYVFAFSDAAGLSQYNSGLSYRILHKNICYSIEAVETGSNTSNIPDYDEMSERNQLLARKIINTFRFLS